MGDPGDEFATRAFERPLTLAGLGKLGAGGGQLTAQRGQLAGHQALLLLLRAAAAVLRVLAERLERGSQGPAVRGEAAGEQEGERQGDGRAGEGHDEDDARVVGGDEHRAGRDDRARRDGEDRRGRRREQRGAQ